MKKIVRSPGSATIINAIATGFGSAFGIGLDIECEAATTSSSIKCSNDVGADTQLMDLCANKVFEHYGIDSDDFGITLKTKSKLPSFYWSIEKDMVDYEKYIISNIVASILLNFFTILIHCILKSIENEIIEGVIEGVAKNQ
jgi:hypothetical protein